MILDLFEIRKKTVPISQYMSCLEQPFRDKFLERKQAYQLQLAATVQLRKVASTYMLIVFSAGWCKDCVSIIPVLALINEVTGLEVRVFGGLKRDPLNPVRKWRIPPSTPEVETFDIDKIPLIILVDAAGREIGRIVENPKHWPTLEQELLEIIKSQQQSLS